MASPTVPFPLIPEQPDVEFRFTIPTARQLERATRPYGGLSGLNLHGSNVEVLVACTWHAMLWNKPKLTEQKAIDWLQAFLDAGGNTVDLWKALNKALEESGVYGRPENPAIEDDKEGDVNPPKTTTEEATT